MTSLVDCFHRHAAGERRVADQGNDMMILLLSIACDRHAERRRNGSGGMTSAERIEFGFITTKETANAPVLLHSWQKVTPSRQNLVRVSLMAHVPYQTIVRRVERVMQCDCQFNRTQRGACVAAHARHGLEDVLTNVVGNVLKLIDVQFPQIRG